jgi:lysozyme
MLEGIDVSEFQGAIDWQAVAGSGKSFAFIRTGDGSYRDKQFSSNWLGAKNAGLVVGAYHFLRPGVDGAEQADICIQMSGGGGGVLPITIDVETPSDPDSLRDLVLAFADEVVSQTGRNPIIYVSPGVWGSNVSPTGLESRCPLWVANWEVSDPVLPSGWSSWSFWQYSSTGTCPGISGGVDLDRFQGSLSALRSMASGGLGVGGAVALLGLGVLGGIGVYEAEKRGMIPSWTSIKEALTRKVQL